MPRLFLDLETYSEIPIRNGTYRYAEGAEILLFAYALGDAEIQVWDCVANRSVPPDLSTALLDPATILVAHNVGFDRTILERSPLAKAFDFSISRWRCTMARAYAHGLPGSLGTLCDIFSIAADKAKDKDGKRLLNLFCIPRKHDKTRATEKTHPADWAKFKEYARLDIAAMRELSRKLPAWNCYDEELNLWRLDQTINSRGMYIDRKLAECAVQAVKEAQAKLAARTDDISMGMLASTTQRDATLKYLLAAYGVDLPDLTASTVERRMEDPTLPLELKELLAIRLQASSTSTAKYVKLLAGLSSDDRVRGTIQYCGASRTGRFSGKLWQPQNLMRPTMKQKDIEFGIEALKANGADLFFENVMELASNTVRGCIIAPPGKKLVDSDLSGIEGRVLPWLAGEKWVLDAYRAYDEGRGHDIYKLVYARAFKIRPEDVTKEQRQIGKVMTLMLGYGGSCGAFVTGALSYRIDLAKLAAGLIHELEPSIEEKAENSWAWAVKEKRTLDLPKDIYVVCRALTETWRRSHPRIVEFWNDLQQAAINATENPGRVFKAGSKITFVRNGNWLRAVLPSGRSLCYASPRYENEEFSYLGNNQYTRKWSRLSTYAGKFAENMTQAVARDIMTANMPRIEAAGYEIVSTIHDEILTEALDDLCHSHEELSVLLATAPSWAEGLPLAASGFETQRYRKDD